MKNLASYSPTLKLVTLFSIAMGFMEAAVVIFLREHYYPSGFDFPVVSISQVSGITEVLREAATLIMLVCIGLLAGRNNTSRFAFFLLAFAIWDLTYYLFLKLILAWPASLLDWDILFLIPVPWFGPVLAPCIISIAMIGFALLLLNGSHKKLKEIISPWNWTGLVGASLLFIGSFVYDYFKHLQSIAFVNEGGAGYVIPGSLSNYIPQSYSWPVFVAGCGLLLLQFYTIHKRIQQH